MRLPIAVFSLLLALPASASAGTVALEGSEVVFRGEAAEDRGQGAEELERVNAVRVRAAVINGVSPVRIGAFGFASAFRSSSTSAGSAYCDCTCNVTPSVPSGISSTRSTKPTCTPASSTGCPCLRPAPHGKRAYIG